jgi:hypothetical protein
VCIYIRICVYIYYVMPSVYIYNVRPNVYMYTYIYFIMLGLIYIY